MIIKDVLYDEFEINGIFEKFINTQPFTRIAKISEFPFPDMNFIGVEITEYEHALGVYRLAELLCEKIDSLYEYSYLLRLASLMHYSISRPFEEPTQRAERSLGINIEESRYISLINHTEVRDLITNDGLKQLFTDAIDLNLSRYKKHKGINAFFNSIIGIKKLDYLPRDIYHANYAYKFQSFNESIFKLALSYDFTDKDKMIINDDTHLRNFLSVYHYMFAEVYLQKNKLITEAMYENIYESLILAGLLDPISQCTTSIDTDIPFFFTLHDDNQLDYLFSLIDNSNSFQYKKATQNLIKRIQIKEPYNVLTRCRLNKEMSAYLYERDIRERLRSDILNGLNLENPYSILLYSPMSEMNSQIQKSSNYDVFIGKNICLMSVDAHQVADYFNDWSDMQYLYVYGDTSIDSLDNIESTERINSIITSFIKRYKSKSMYEEV
jgi:HD superfamily phosphohydrolase